MRDECSHLKNHEPSRDDCAFIPTFFENEFELVIPESLRDEVWCEHSSRNDCAFIARSKLGVNTV